MENMMLLVLGICISVLGIVNIRGNISTIHSYNRRKVKEEDVPKYGKAVGTGTLIMGISLVLAYIAAFWNESMMPYIVFRQLSLAWHLFCTGKSSTTTAFFDSPKTALQEAPPAGLFFC